MASRTGRTSSSRVAHSGTRSRDTSERKVRDELRLVRLEHSGRASHESEDARRKSRKTERSESRVAARRTEKDAASAPSKTVRLKNSGGAVQFFTAVIIFLIAAINFFAVFSSYAQNVAQLNSLKSQEAQLTQQKADLTNDISRWKDKAYVTAQARKRFGFVFPGEKSVIVKNAPDELTDADSREVRTQSSPELPWYTEILYSIQSADQAENQTGAQTK